ncbi:MAG: signal recognition particle-docking protein FtsY [Herpetosiphon sp.]
MFRRIFGGDRPSPPKEEPVTPQVTPADGTDGDQTVVESPPKPEADLAVSVPETAGASAAIAENQFEFKSVAEYDAANAPVQAPPRRLGGLRRLFGGEERPVEEIREEEAKTQQAVEKTRTGLFGKISELFQTDDPITDDLWNELEDLMIMADVGIDTTVHVIERVRRRVERNNVMGAREARGILKQELRGWLEVSTRTAEVSERTTKPYIVLVIGVNGAGKTTLIAKLASRYKNGLQKQVLLAAADTFRAAAVEQLTTWADRVGVPVIAQGQGADPGAVAFDAVHAAFARDSDILIIDTAGRLQSKYNLMQELQKIRNIVRKRAADGPHEVLLVVDATTGQNGLSQARAFAEAADVTHLALTKLDGTAKGGIAFAMVQEIRRPIKYIGTGEKVGDLAIFDPQAFVDALFGDK